MMIYDDAKFEYGLICFGDQINTVFVQIQMKSPLFFLRRTLYVLHHYIHQRYTHATPST
jgi:hypothetical protein